MNHGIEDKYLESIKTILAENCQNLEKVCLFGSRATGKFTRTSDIDLVLYGNISEQEGDRIYTQLLESMIPHKIDVTVYGHVTYPSLKRQIDSTVKPLFDKKALYSN